ncbi:hypothetical protein [Deinococcus arcticus]|uniref:Uncharacterized protein n=1 Tax=Deinococcus arcticus TaxID=2136176 RepID=A0A2T3W999_9DEIO|nr:hypothetical protein [Deinococcus arcticus]PTA68480.1 hypothetical protein C8263_06665 [Deinococcus arcticus]
MISIRRDDAAALTGEVLSSDDPRLHPGQPVRLTVRTLGGKTCLKMQGRPVTLAPPADTDQALNVDLS